MEPVLPFPTEAMNADAEMASYKTAQHVISGTVETTATRVSLRLQVTDNSTKFLFSLWVVAP